MLINAGSSATGVGGVATLSGGLSGSNAGGAVSVTAGSSTSGTGGGTTLSGGLSGSNVGGDISIQSGNGGTSAGTVDITGGQEAKHY